MREILFRGKDQYNDWIYGYLCQHRGDPIMDNGGAELVGSDYYIRDWAEKIDTGFYGCNYRVDPSTIGQYTGMNDKNGNEIFEGDIVKLFDAAVGEIVQECGAFGIGCRQLIDFDYLASEIAPVTGHNNTPLFCYNDNFVSLWELYWNYNEENDEISVIEVIGNIHDNPELLEADK